jgi:glucan endo-1,3-beta-D-glucosidase
VSAVDWLGFDGYPYFQNTQANGIENGAQLLFESYNATVAASQGKPVWITETGWPVSGPTENQAVASPENAARYWQDVACRVLGNIPTYWYTLQDAYPFTPSPSFGIVGSDLNSAPLYDLSCKNGNASPSSSPSSIIVATSTAVAASSGANSEMPSSTVSLATAPGVESSAVSTSTPAPSATSSYPAGGEGKTFTRYSTTLITVTSCPSSCAPHPSTATAAATSETATPPAASSCPTNLNGPYEFPHLIVPVDSANPSKAYGTSYNGTISPSVSSIFNFDIPSSYAGKTCSLVFLFPELSQLETSSYSFNNQGGLAITGLVSPATEQTTFDSVPASNGQKRSIERVVPGNGYSILTQECPAGQRISFEFSSVGGLDVNFFQDYNPSPLGVYVTVC